MLSQMQEEVSAKTHRPRLPAVGGKQFALIGSQTTVSSRITFLSVFLVKD